MTTMPDERRKTFLAEPRVGVVAVEWENRAPLNVPVWYRYDVDGDVSVWTYADSVKLRLMRAAGRFSLSSQSQDLPYRYVTVEGPVTSVEPATQEWVHQLAVHYLGPTRGAHYAANDFKPESVIVRMRPQRWFSGEFLTDDVYISPGAGS
ncbi:pyridoxamine 5'-phosphate oxidase family protein [Mycobacterium sp. SMC-4]|uniref:pyridoxamine 5'-phosphate oxidase family protein n=1 Tax=Mycobacterium sp. SMC-4 TaxID=2857059 RepID=UPI003D07CE82